MPFIFLCYCVCGYFLNNKKTFESSVCIRNSVKCFIMISFNPNKPLRRHYYLTLKKLRHRAFKLTYPGSYSQEMVKLGFKPRHSGPKTYAPNHIDS